MSQVFAEIFERQINEIFSKMANLNCKIKPAKKISLKDDFLISKGPLAKIDYQVEVAGSTPLSGVFYLNSSQEDLEILLKSSALFLGASFTDIALQKQDLLGEVFNIVVGHTIGKWGEHGVKADISPPVFIDELLTTSEKELVFLIDIDSEKLNKLQFLVIFPERPFRTGVGC